jgi:hypothetical protein
MLLSEVRVVGVGPLEDCVVRVASDGRPRLATVIVGAGGTGKSSLLGAIASTRPGHALPLGRPWGARPLSPPAFAVAEWVLDDDDPTRPHPLRVASPNAVLEERDDEATLRRREQSHFDRRATEGGFACVAISGARWFSRSPVLLSSPERTILRYDPRAAAAFDDATRADLARDTKQLLAYAGVAAALAGESADASAVAARSLNAAVWGAVQPVAQLAGIHYGGVDPSTLEPFFDGTPVGRQSFDELPTSARHLLSLVILPLRALAGAYPGRDPRQAQGVVLVDDVDLHLEPRVQHGLVAALKQALPRVQWIVTTASEAVALGCDAGEVIALRRMESSSVVEVHEGDLAVTH